MSLLNADTYYPAAEFSSHPKKCSVVENTIDVDDPELKVILMLLSEMVNKINKFGTRCMNAERQLCIATRKSEQLDKKCYSLQAEIDSLRSETCSECPKLKKSLQLHRRRVHDVEARLKSIAEILNIGKTNEGLALAHSMATQILTEDVMSTKRSLNDSKENSDIGNTSDFPVTVEEVQLTPKKPKNDLVPNTSPIICKGQKSVSTRKVTSPMKKDACSQIRALAPLSINTLVSSQKSNGSDGLMTENTKEKKRVIEKVVTNDISGSVEKKVWSLRKSRDIGAYGNKERFKQTTLSVLIGKKEDISKIPEFNGGDEKSECQGLAEESNADETIFLPLATSTENVFQVIEEKSDRNYLKIVSDKSKQFKSNELPYRRDIVRKRSERLQLPGQDCQNCYKFYEQYKSDMTDSQIKAFKNACSKHRDKYPIRISTPPGFWNPLIDDSDADSDKSQEIK